MDISSTNISEPERESYDNVLGKLDEYFHVRHNVIFERARLTRWKVSPGTSILLNCTIWQNGAHMDH